MNVGLFGCVIELWGTTTTTKMFDLQLPFPDDVAHCGFHQVGEQYVFTVADTSRVDRFEIVVEDAGHNALADFSGPAKVSYCVDWR